MVQCSILSSMSSPPSIPWRALIPLLIGRFSAGGVYSCPFPFLPSMLKSMDLSTTRVAFWTGFAESALMAAELVTAVPMSRLSDQLGRRPVLVTSMLWSAVTCAGLGLSSTVAEVIIWRLLAGITAMRQVGRLVLGEISNEHNRVRMFSIFGPAGTIGILVGRMTGGTLAEPEGRIPWLGDFALFQARPYLLPVLAMAIWPFIGFFLTLRYMRETKPSTLSAAGLKPSIRDALRQPGLLYLLVAFAIGQSVETAVFAATTLIASVSVEEGGWGLSLQEIAYLLVGLSICYLVLAPTTLNVLSAKLSKEQCLSYLSAGWLCLPPIYSVAIYHAKTNKTALIADLVIFSMLRAVANSCWMFYDMIAIETSTAELLSSTNACLTLFGGVGRVIGPASFGWAYSITLTYPVESAARGAIWIMLFVIAALPLPLLRLARQEQKRAAAAMAPQEMELLVDGDELRD